MWCRGAELNCRHRDFQSRALPTELPRHSRWRALAACGRKASISPASQGLGRRVESISMRDRTHAAVPVPSVTSLRHSRGVHGAGHADSLGDFLPVPPPLAPTTAPDERHVDAQSRSGVRPIRSLARLLSGCEWRCPWWQWSGTEGQSGAQPPGSRADREPPTSAADYRRIP